MENSAVILYVEDNADNRKLITRLLTAYDYTVHTASDGPAGLEFVQHHTPDLILMDMSMPGMDGYEVTERMRQLPHLAQVPIVALTANVMKGDKERSLEVGCDGYIQKPISIDNFPQQIQSFLQKRRLK